MFWPKDILSPNMMQTVAVTTADYATEGAAKLRGGIAGRRDGVRYIEDHTDEAADITAKAFNGNPASIATYSPPLRGIHYWSEGKFDYDAMNLMVEGLQIVGKQKGPVNWPSRSLLFPALRPAERLAPSVCG